MANLNATTANIRLTGTDKKSVCSANNVMPNVQADKAAAFASAVETLYNNGACTAQIRMVYSLTA